MLFRSIVHFRGTEGVADIHAIRVIFSISHIRFGHQAKHVDNNSASIVFGSAYSHIDIILRGLKLITVSNARHSTFEYGTVAGSYLFIFISLIQNFFVHFSDSSSKHTFIEAIPLLNNDFWFCRAFSFAIVFWARAHRSHRLRYLFNINNKVRLDTL